MAKSPKKTPSTPPANPYGPMIRFSYGSALKKKPKNTANTNTIQSVETGVPGIIIHFGTRPDKVCSYIWPFKNYHEQYAEIEDLIRKWGCNGKFPFVLCTYCRFGCIYLISFIYIIYTGFATRKLVTEDIDILDNVRMPGTPGESILDLSSQTSIAIELIYHYLIARSRYLYVLIYFIYYHVFSHC